MRLPLLVAVCLCVPAFAGVSELKLCCCKPFDTVHVYQGAGPDSEVVLFISGDGGWNLGVVGMAKMLAGMGATVVGVNIVKYMKKLNASTEKCVYPAADFEDLSKYVQQKLAFPRYRTPIVIGYSSGATLAYVVLAEAPVGTFKGAISMGFCPDLPMTVPPCNGSGLTHGPGPRHRGFSFPPTKTMSAHWIAFQGTIDKVCCPDSVDTFVSQTADAEVMSLPKVGHGFSVERRWVPQFKDAFKQIIQKYEEASPKPVDTGPSDVNDLPLIEVPAAAGTAQKDEFVIFLSGDGGWAGIDRGISAALTDSGVPVVGWNSLQYYWTKRTPEQASTDLARIIRHYQKAWKKDKYILIGYSFGANALPFLASRLDKDMLEKADKIGYVGLALQGEFEFHLGDWVGSFAKDAQPTMPEIKKLAGRTMVYFYGTEEKETVVADIDSQIVNVVALPGGHHYSGRFDLIAQGILSAVPKERKH